MENVAAGEDTGNAGLKLLGYFRAPGGPAQSDTGLFGELILRDQSGGYEKGVAGNLEFRAGNEPAVFVYFGDEDRADALFAAHLGDDGIVIDRDIKIFYALFHIAGQSARPGHDLHDSGDLAALQNELAGHDQTDVS